MSVRPFCLVDYTVYIIYMYKIFISVYTISIYMRRPCIIRCQGINPTTSCQAFWCCPLNMRVGHLRLPKSHLFLVAGQTIISVDMYFASV